MTRRALFNAIAWYVKRTPPHPGRGVLARLAWRVDPHDIVCEIAPGARIRIRIDRDDDLAYWTNRYDRHGDARVFASLLRPGMVVADVGANIGFYALLAAHAVGTGGRVLAFEPVPDVYRRLVENLAVSDFTNVSPHQIALSNASGMSPLYLGRNDSMGSLCRAQTSSSIEVMTSTLDEFLERQQITRVDAVKVDAEGAEMRIVSGMHRLLARADRPVLFVEHNGDALRAAGSSDEELFATIVDYGYVPYLVEDGHLRRVQALAVPFTGADEAYANYVFQPRMTGL